MTILERCQKSQPNTAARNIFGQPPKLPIPVRTLAPSKTWILWFTQVHIWNGILISSAVLQGSCSWPTQTHIHTDWLHYKCCNSTHPMLCTATGLIIQCKQLGKSPRANECLFSLLLCSALSRRLTYTEIQPFLAAVSCWMRNQILS